MAIPEELEYILGCAACSPEGKIIMPRIIAVIALTIPAIYQVPLLTG